MYVISPDGIYHQSKTFYDGYHDPYNSDFTYCEKKIKKDWSLLLFVDIDIIGDVDICLECERINKNE